MSAGRPLALALAALAPLALGGCLGVETTQDKSAAKAKNAKKASRTPTASPRSCA